MDLERVAVALRPRRSWEAVDLGMRFALRLGPALWLPWLGLLLAIHALVWLALHGLPGLAFLVLWWLKPLYDRLPLLVASRALFGSTPSLGATARELPRTLARGLLADLLWRRLDPRRGFRLPVTQLERLSGAPRRRRLASLERFSSDQCEQLSAASLLLELCATLGLLALSLYAIPEPLQERALEALGADGSEQLLLALLAGAWFLALAALEPLYVVGGFLLYINRRTELEGWDLELWLKRIGQRSERQRIERERRGELGLALALLAGLALPLLTAGPARAQEAEPDPGAKILEVLASEDFGGTRTEETWRFKRKEKQPAERAAGALSPPLGLLSVVMWGALILCGVALAAALIYGLTRFGGGWSSAPEEEAAARPLSVAGLDLRPESLPPDVTRAALRLWEQGDAVGALSLLYRGSLVRLIDEWGLELRESATEGDCERAVRRASGPSAWFDDLSGAWQEAAYAGRRPAEERFRRLCAGYEPALERA